MQSALLQRQDVMAERCGNNLTGTEGLPSDFALILTIKYNVYEHCLLDMVDVWSRILYQKREVNALLICKPPINQGFKGI